MLLLWLWLLRCTLLRFLLLLRLLQLLGYDCVQCLLLRDVLWLLLVGYVPGSQLTHWDVTSGALVGSETSAGHLE
jgi:hypothetical protein